MKKRCLVFLILFVLSLSAYTQSKYTLQNSEKDKISFKLINNLIVIPVEVNGVPLSFLLDTGVSKAIIFNFVNVSDELKINRTEEFFLRGLGEGDTVQALKSSDNIFKIGDAVNIEQDVFTIFDPSLNFTPQLGIPIHGIIGYDLLKDFVVEINYSKKQIVLHDPDFYQPKKCKKCETFNLDFSTKKPFINGSVAIRDNEKSVPVKLLIDSGGSDALWLFKDKEHNINVPTRYFDDFLGRGLSGSVYGKRSKISRFSIGSFTLESVNTAFPDSTSIAFAKKFKERNGSLGGEILKRFNVIFDYSNKKITLRKNSSFKEPFYYNKSGISLEHSGMRVVKELDKKQAKMPYGTTNNSAGGNIINLSKSYKYVLAPSLAIVELRKGSPAEKAGLRLDDIILSVNNKDVHLYSIQEVIQLFYGPDGKRVRMIIDRNGVQMKFSFQLESMF
ncbi:PDZ domain-containing protein [Pontimicrobium aquaticum]|uniref:PDZ domain-containing protein n=1 Tax=Pontimicrobium aquaticum TaxID=2565367 RepID=A0A4V5LQZ6_9FLAO|nr:PDZ domain-containing protein [Pontimicrobium aquaticum]TJY37329.1 PDZ domain-containing protein [Pontimicrobium aquaticum]